MQPDPALPMNASFINDAIDLDALVAVLTKVGGTIAEAYNITDQQPQTTAFVVDVGGKPRYCFSNRTIKAGEEITVAYGSNYWYHYIMKNPACSEFIRLKALTMLWTKYEKSPASIPCKRAQWFDRVHSYHTNLDTNPSSFRTPQAFMAQVWKNMIKTLIDCIAYIGLEKGDEASSFVKYTLADWSRLLGTVATRTFHSNQAFAEPSLDQFWSLVGISKRLL